MGYEKFSLPYPWDATPNKLQYVDGDPSATTTLLAGRFRAGMLTQPPENKVGPKHPVINGVTWHGAPFFLAENNYPMILRILGFFSSLLTWQIHHPWRPFTLPQYHRLDTCVSLVLFHPEISGFISVFGPTLKAPIGFLESAYCGSAPYIVLLAVHNCYLH